MKDASAGARRKPRFFYGWWIVLVAFLGDMIGGGVGPSTFALFVIPMGDSLGLGRAALSAGLTVRTFAAAFASPLIGPMIDRYGPRVIMAVGGIVGGLATMSLAGVNSLWYFLAAYGAMGALGTAGMGPLVTSTAVAKWFIRRRGRAMALATAGFSTGLLVMVPISQTLISTVGWRAAWVVLGTITWLLVVPPALIWLRRSPEDMGLRPDGDEDPLTPSPEAAKGAHNPGPTSQEPVWTLREAVRTPTLWLVVIAFNLGGIAVSGMTMHQAPAIVDKGFSPALAAAVVTVFAAVATVSKLVFGFLAERIPVRYLLIVMFAGSAAGLTILIVADSVAMVFAFGLVYGFMRGGYSTINSIIWADYFGRAFLGTIRGVFMPTQLIASAGGPLFAGILWDLKGNYQFAFTVFVLLYLTAAVVIFLARPPRKPEVRVAGPARATA